MSITPFSPSLPPSLPPSPPSLLLPSLPPSLPPSPPHQSSLRGHQFLFSIEPSGDAHGHKNICLRYDVYTLIWEPVSDQHGGPMSWSHRASFNALGYIQASKTDKKFIVCPPDTRFAVLSTATDMCLSTGFPAVVCRATQHCSMCTRWRPLRRYWVCRPPPHTSLC